LLTESESLIEPSMVFAGPSANLRFLNDRSILLLYGWTAVVERQ
jgi:hypothetical protein